MKEEKTNIKRNIINAFVFGCILFFTEFCLDTIFGDGDGVISSYGIHKFILTIQLILTFYILLFTIKSIYKTLPLRDVLQIRLLIAGKIFVVLLIFTSCFIFLEMASRLFFPAEGTYDRPFPVENARKPFPYVMFKGAAGTKTGFSNEVYNEYGYRGKYPSFHKDSNEYRIIIAGGSAVWEGEPSIPELLKKTFHENGKVNIRVYNFGVVGANSQMELATLSNEIIALKPDMILFYDGANDIIHPLHYDPRPGYPFNFLIYENNPFLKQRYPFLALIAYKSNFIRLIAKNYFAEHISKINLLREECGYNTEEWRNKIALTYLNNISKADVVSKAINAKFKVFFQPMVYSKNILSVKEKKFIANHSLEKIHATLVYKKILNAISGQQLNFYDMSAIYANDSAEIFRDNVHTLQPAREKAARAIYNIISQELTTSLDPLP